MPKIFLSYRRQDSAGISGRIYDRLAKRFGNESVFMDIDSIPSGVDFRSYVRSALTECEVMLVVIGRDWEGNSLGSRRIDDPEDFVRIEVETALERALPVIPIVIDRATIPAKADLPDRLQDLAFLNAFFLDQGRHFHHHASELIKGVELLLKRRKPPSWMSTMKATWAVHAARRRELVVAKKAERAAVAERQREIVDFKKAERFAVAELAWDGLHDVFISYDRSDQAECDIVLKTLTENGFRAMRSQGSIIDETTGLGNVRVHRCFLLLLSKNSLRSDQGCHEVHAAIEARRQRKIKSIKIFRLDDSAGAIRRANALGITSVINEVRGDWRDDLVHLSKSLRQGRLAILAANDPLLLYLFYFIIAIIPSIITLLFTAWCVSWVRAPS
jgi:hypothetical protein